MDKRQKERRLAWWIAAGMTAVLMAVVLTLGDVRLGTADDGPILRAFLGYESGAPARVHIYLHGLLGKPLGWLGMLIPGVPWYSWMMLALMALALTVMAKSLMQCFVNRQKPLWMGALLSAAFFIGFGVEYTVVFTFTQTAAFLGAAAVLQLLSTDVSRKNGLVLSCAGAAVCAGLAYCIRQSSLVPVVALCGLAFVNLLWKHRLPIRPILSALCVIVVLLGGLVGWRQIELSDPDMQDYLEWQDANGYLIDYYGLGALTEEEIALGGWSDATLALAYEWCFLDSDLDAESFQRVTEAVQQKEQPPMVEQLRSAKRLFLKRAAGTEYEYRILLGFAGLVFAACGLGSLFQKGKRVRLLFVLCALAAGSGVMIVYLAMQGRVPLRAVLTIALPALALLLGLLPECVPDRGAASAVLAVLCAALLVCSAIHIDDVKGLLWKSIRGESAASTAFTDAEAYALAQPGSLFILHGGVQGDFNAFPDYAEGMPNNLSFWGHWGMRSPENAALFERFGIDIWHFDPAHLLREDVFLIVPKDGGPGVLLDWLREKISPEIAWETVETHGRIDVLKFVEK